MTPVSKADYKAALRLRKSGKRSRDDDYRSDSKRSRKEKGWIIEDIRVRIVSESYKRGQYYNQKVVSPLWTHHLTLVTGQSVGCTVPHRVQLCHRQRQSIGWYELNTLLLSLTIGDRSEAKVFGNNCPKAHWRGSHGRKREVPSQAR